MQVLEDMVRHARTGKGLGKTLRAQRRLVGVLEHDRIAAKKRGPDRVHGCQIGIVPRRDDDDDPDRIALYLTFEPRLLRGNDGSERLWSDGDHVIGAFLEATYFL